VILPLFFPPNILNAYPPLSGDRKELSCKKEFRTFSACVSWPLASSCSIFLFSESRVFLVVFPSFLDVLSPKLIHTFPLKLPLPPTSKLDIFFFVLKGWEKVSSLLITFFSPSPFLYALKWSSPFLFFSPQKGVRQYEGSHLNFVSDRTRLSDPEFFLSSLLHFARRLFSFSLLLSEIDLAFSPC